MSYKKGTIIALFVEFIILGLLLINFNSHLFITLFFNAGCFSLLLAHSFDLNFEKNMKLHYRHIKIKQSKTKEIVEENIKKSTDYNMDGEYIGSPNFDNSAHVVFYYSENWLKIAIIKPLLIFFVGFLSLYFNCGLLKSLKPSIFESIVHFFDYVYDVPFSLLFGIKIGIPTTLFCGFIFLGFRGLKHDSMTNHSLILLRKSISLEQPIAFHI